MTFVSPRVLPPGLPAWLAPAHRHVCGWVERLPAAPPSFLMAQLLDRVLWTRLPVDVRAALAGRCIELRVSDFGLRLRLMLTDKGFARNDAYRLVQKHAMQAWETGADLKALLLADSEITGRLTRAVVEKVFDLNVHFKDVNRTFKAVGL
jgi:hypothetical protein